MRMASLHCVKLYLNPLEKNQAWLEEAQARPEIGYPTEYVCCVEINVRIPKLWYLCMSSKPILSPDNHSLLF